MTIAIEPCSQFEGIYEAPEVARFIAVTLSPRLPLRIPSDKVVRWIRLGLTTPELKEVPGRQLLLTFEDLISMRVIAALRAAGVSFHKIRTAEKWLRSYTGHKRPFATEMLWTERSDIFIELKRQYVAASRFGQYAFTILEEYLIPVHGLMFDKRGVAVSWEPKEAILLDPLIQFGAPCIKGTRIPTRTLWGMIVGGDTMEYVARSYRIAAELVQNAVDWENSLNRR